MSVGLTPVGYGWVILSLVSSLCVATGFYIPIWIVGSIDINGKKVQTFFGSFRRCNYPIFDRDSNVFRIEEKCGRYSTFGDIPSLHWQVATVIIAAGCALSLLLTFILIPACCIRDIVTRSSALVIGLMQVLAAVAVSVGCVIYPLGWNVREVRDACGAAADQFLLGSCEFGWAYVLMLTGSALLLLCGLLSVKGGKRRGWRDPPSFEQQSLMQPLRLTGTSQPINYPLYSL